MEPKALIQLLWVTGMVCQAALAVVLLAKRAWKGFPLFASYSWFNLLSAIFIYYAQENPRLYFYSYWVAEAAGIILGFAVLYEVFGHLFSGHAALRKIAVVGFNCVLGLFLCIGTVVLLKHSGTSLGAISTAVLVVEESARIVEIGVLMALFLLSTAFGLHWRQHVFGIALGLGLFAAVELIAVTMRAQAGTTTDYLFGAVRIIAFNSSLLIWLGYFLTPERAATGAELPQRSQLEQWNQAVMELIRQ